MGCNQAKFKVEQPQNVNQAHDAALARRRNSGAQRQSANAGNERRERRNPRQGQQAQGSGPAVSQGGRLQIQYLQNTAVETIIEGKTSGEGIQKTPAYETPYSKNDLDKWREQFWETRTSGHRQVWEVLKTCCGEDPETANALIMAAELQMPQNSLTLVVDASGVYYRVPVCVINDPITYDKDYMTQKLKKKEAPKKEIIQKVKIRSGPHDNLIEISNQASIIELKELFVQLSNQKSRYDVEITPSQVRMFCMGKELKDDLHMFSYSIADGTTIQAMVKL